MTLQAYTQAIQGMVALPPTVLEHLLTLAPQMTDDERDEALATITPVYGQIEQESKELMEYIDDDMKNIRREKRAAQKGLEAREHAAAEKLLDDDQHPAA